LGYFFGHFACGITKGLTDITKLSIKGKAVHFGFSQAMSGISTTEDKLTRGAIERRLGEGKTADVLTSKINIVHLSISRVIIRNRIKCMIKSQYS
jgi:hypothetical protein